MDKALKNKLVGEAVELQQRNRLRSFIDIPDNILGVDICHLTLQKLIWLELAKNPFVCRRPKSEKTDIALQAAAIKMFWICSTEYVPPLTRAARRTMRKFEKRLLKFSAETLILHANRFIFDTFFEDGIFVDEKRDKSRRIPFPTHCSAAYYIALLAKEFGWDEERILDMPMRRILQYENQIFMRCDHEYKPASYPSYVSTILLNKGSV